MKPTLEMGLFGDAAQLYLFGKDTGDWSLKGCGPQATPGLFHRLGEVMNITGAKELLAPDPTSFNAGICTPRELTQIIQNGHGGAVIRRGVFADAVLLENKGQVAMLSTGDCPTIIVYFRRRGRLYIAHAGAGSIIDIGHVLKGESPREFPSVVDAIMQREDYDFNAEVYVACGIHASRYEYPDLSEFVRKEYGEICTWGMKNVSLVEVITRQFLEYHVLNVSSSQIDTYSDLDIDGEPRWHSYRRATHSQSLTEGKELQTSRNLVVVKFK